MSGLDLETIKKVSGSVNIPVIACGGAGNLKHIKEAVNSGASAVAAGSMFVFHSARKGVLINYPDKEEILEVFKLYDFQYE